MIKNFKYYNIVLIILNIISSFIAIKLNFKNKRLIYQNNII